MIRTVSIVLSLLVACLTLISCTPADEALLSPGVPTEPPAPAVSQAPEQGVWVATPLDPEEAAYQFRLQYDPGEWELESEELQDRLIHGSLKDCAIRLTGGMGMPPGWSAHNSLVTVDDLQYLRVDLRFEGELQFITMWSGTEDVEVGFQIGTELITQECIDRAYAVLATLEVIVPD